MIAARIALLPVALGILLGGCGGPTVDGLALDQTAWRAVRIVGRLPVAGHEPTLIFASGAVSGTAGCNGYGSQHVSISDGRISIDELGMTAMLCGAADGELMRREDDFFLNLRTATTIGLRDGQLVIIGGTGELIFDRIGPSESLR